MGQLAKSAKPEPFTINKAQVAYMLGCSLRSTLTLAREGLPIRHKGRGKAGWTVDPKDLLEWWTARRLAQEKPDNETHELAKQRLTEERAERARIDNELARGELVKAAHVEEFAMHLAAMLASELSGLDSRLADATHQPTAAERRAVIKATVNEVRSRFSRGCAELAESCRNGGPVRGGNGAAAGSHAG